MTNTEIAVLDDASEDFGGLLEARVAGLLDTARSRITSSMPTGTEEEQDAMFNAMTNSEPLKENLNKAFNLKHVIVEPVTITDPNTGEANDAPRAVLVKDDGTSYHATSNGVLSSLERLFRVYGTPEHWATPKRVVAVTVKTRKGDAIILNAAPKK